MQPERKKSYPKTPLLVSVILCNYNYGRFIGEAIESVLKQSYPHFELIIVDDGSTDNSRQVIQSFDDRRIQTVFQENGGQAAAFNAGFARASGELVAFLDSDDWWTKRKLRHVVRTFQRYSDVSVVQHNMKVVDQYSQPTGKQHPRIKPGTLDVLKDYFIVHHTNFFSATSGIVCRRDNLEQIFPLDEEAWRICADVAFTRPMPIFGKVHTLKALLGAYRIHGSNTWMYSEAQSHHFETQQKYIDYTNEWLAHYGIEHRLNIQQSRLFRSPPSYQSQFSEIKLLQFYPFRGKRRVMLDVGAHEGSSSKPFARKGWYVVAFEPEPQNRSAFERNLAGYQRVLCIPRAVSDVDGQKVPFYVSTEHYDIHSLKPFHRTHQPGLEVETVRLDTILQQMGIRSVSLLKIDTEGADLLVLKGFDFATYHPDVVMVEFMDERSLQHFGYTHHDMVAYMQEQGYTTFVSEWAPFQDYGRKGSATTSHTWIQCVPYPLDHTPAWGNLIFVPHTQVNTFKSTLRLYILLSPLRKVKTSLRNHLGSITFAREIYRWLKGHHQEQ
jgi:FkbM family methyltransferase